MSEQTPATTPFDASVVDEASMRALRAVHRSLPQGSGGTSGLAGGTVAAAGAGMMMQGEQRQQALAPDGAGLPAAGASEARHPGGAPDSPPAGIEITPLAVPEAASSPPVAAAAFWPANLAAAPREAVPPVAVAPVPVTGSGSLVPDQPIAIPLQEAGGFTPPPHLEAPRATTPAAALTEDTPVAETVPQASAPVATSAHSVPPAVAPTSPQSEAAPATPETLPAVSAPDVHAPGGAVPDHSGATDAVAPAPDVSVEAPVPIPSVAAPPETPAPVVPESPTAEPVSSAPVPAPVVPAPETAGPTTPAPDTPVAGPTPPVATVPEAPTHMPETPDPEPAAPLVVPTPEMTEPTPPAPDTPVAEPTPPAVTAPEATAPTPVVPTPQTAEPVVPAPEVPPPPVPEIPAPEPAAPPAVPTPVMTEPTPTAPAPTPTPSGPDTPVVELTPPVVTAPEAPAPTSVVPTPQTAEPVVPAPEMPPPLVSETPDPEPAAPPVVPTPVMTEPTPPVVPTPQTAEPVMPAPEMPPPPVPEIPGSEPAAPTQVVPVSETAGPVTPEPEPPPPPVPDTSVAEPTPPVVTPPEAPPPAPVAPVPEPIVPEVPVVTAVAAAGDEDQATALDLSAQLNGRNWVAVLSVGIVGLPEGAMLSAGTRQADGSWSLAPAQLAGLTLTPAPDFAGTLALTLQATAQGADGAVTRAETTFAVQVAAVVDGATLTAQAAGEEDQWITLQAAFGASTDASEYWLAQVLVQGVPVGALLSGGTDLGGGIWSVERMALEAGQVAIRPPAGSDAPIDLRLEAVLRDGDGAGAERAIASHLTVQVAAVASTPLVTVANLAGQEDTALRLTGLGGALTDLDGSETLSFVLSGLPDGAVLDTGSKQADGSWRLTPAQLTDVSLTPPAQFSGILNLTLTAVATEGSAGARSAANFTVSIDPVVDRGVINGHAGGLEDGWLSLRPSFDTPDNDGSESWSPTSQITGVPEGATLSRGTQLSPGVWEVSTDELRGGQISILPPRNNDADFTLTVTATLTDTGNGTSVSRVITGINTVGVGGRADDPLVTVADVAGKEDTALRLIGLGGALTDLDGSETLSFVLSGLPSGAALNTGSKQADGSWRLTPAQLATVSLTPPAQFSGSFALTLTAVATEGADGAPSATASASFTVSLDPVADAGTISGKVTGKEDTAIVLRPTFSTPDGDGSETWSVLSRISGVPTGATLSLGTEVSAGVWDVPTADLRAGRVSVRPPADSDVDLSLRITATLTDTGNGKSVSRSISGTYTVVVDPVADAPLASAAAATGREDTPVALQLAAGLSDTDGSESLSLLLLGMPAGATLSRGSRNADGSWSLAAADLAGLTLTPPADFSGTLNLTLRATASDRGSSTAVTNTPFNVIIAGVADAPGLRTGPAAGPEDSAIALRVSGWTTDIDGSETLVGFRIAGLPDGAVLRAGGVVLAREADGSVLVNPAAITSLSVTPPANSDGDFVLRVSAISSEPSGSTAESAPRNLAVRVEAVADAPQLAASTAAGLEDTAIALDFGAQLRDGDGSERLSLLVSGLPEGARLSAGTYAGNGGWVLTAAEAQQVLLLPPRDYAGTITLSVTAVAQEQNGGAEARSKATMTVRVEAVVDAPMVGGLDGVSGNFGTAAGDEDRPIALCINPGLRDASEHLVGAVTLVGVPAGAVLRLADGTVVPVGADGQHSVDATRLTGLTLTLPRDSDVAVQLILRMTIEDTGGVRQTIGGTLLVDPHGVADVPQLTVQDAQAAGHSGDDAAAGWVALPIAAQLVDTDGSERLYLWVRDVPDGFLLSAGTPAGEGVWLVPAGVIATLAIRPPAGFSGTATLRIEAMAQEREGGTASTGQVLHLSIAPGGSTIVPAIVPPPALAAAADAGVEDTSSALHISLAGGGAGEMLGLRVSGVPAGATLSAGLRDSESGDWVLAPQELSGLRLVPPADFSGTLALVLHGVAVTPEGSVLSTRRTLDVTVEAVADGPSLGATPEPGHEDTSVALHLSAQLSDADGSESIISVLLSGLPAGASIAPGTGITDNGDGTWSVAPAELGGVRLLPPADAAGTLTLTMTATTREASSGATRATTRQVSVAIEAVPDAPLVSAADAVGQEDTAIALQLGAALTDRDGSEKLSLTLEGLPAGALLSAGLNNGDGSWTLTPGQLTGLRLTPPGNWSGDMALTLVAHAMENANANAASTRVSFQVSVSGVADAPLYDAPATLRGDEDSVLPLDLHAQLSDQDGSESLSAVVTGVPDGGHLTSGSRNADGSWTVPGAALEGLGFVPPANYSGTLRLGVTVLATEAAGGSASQSSEIVVTVRPATDAPLLTLGAALGQEDSAIALPIGAALADTDGSEQLSRVVIRGVPSTAKLSLGSKASDGSWVLQPGQLEGLSLTPAPNYAGRIALTVTAVSVEAANGIEASTTGTLDVAVVPVADTPMLTAANVSGSEDQTVSLALTAVLGDIDKSEQFSSITLGGLPEGFALSAGTALGDGVWHLKATELTGLKLVPAADWHGTLTLSLQATSVDSAAGLSDSASASRNFTVTIAPVNDAPVLGLVAAPSEPGGLHEAQAFASVAVADVDNARMSGATITLGHGQVGDVLAFEGLELRQEGGRLMIGDTGIEVVGQGYDAATGSLVLRGAASPAAYQAVLQALVLENPQESGLAPGTRDIQVTLRDEAGASAAPQSVALAVAALPTEAAPRLFTGTSASEVMIGGAGVDVFTLAPHGGHDSIDGGGGWTDLIEITGAGGLHDAQAGWTLVVETPGVVVTETAHGVQLDQPTAGHIQFADGSQADFVHIERIGWS
jgi:hypothetical protein